MPMPRPQIYSERKTVALVFVLFCLAAAFAPRGFAASPPSSPVALRFAIADFDGDNVPDFATVQTGQMNPLHTRYWIGLQLSGGSRQSIGVTAPAGGLQITSRDINGDTFLDVIVTTAWTNRPVAVLLNDGHGNFTPSDPSAFPALIRNSEASWTCSTREIRDASAALLSRNLSGECEELARHSSPRLVTGFVFPPASRNSSFLTAPSFLGRAPPSIHSHL
jgi:hypothetical protein